MRVYAVAADSVAVSVCCKYVYVTLLPATPPPPCRRARDAPAGRGPAWRTRRMRLCAGFAPIWRAADRAANATRAVRQHRAAARWLIRHATQPRARVRAHARRSREHSPATKRQLPPLAHRLRPTHENTVLALAVLAAWPAPSLRPAPSSRLPTAPSRALQNGRTAMLGILGATCHSCVDSCDYHFFHPTTHN